jgi:long-chain acyl-CoA synthetase
MHDRRVRSRPFLDTLLHRVDIPGVGNRTVCDIFFESVRRYRKPDHLRVKRDGAWRDISSDEYGRAVSELSMGLRELGVAAGDRVAILSENRPEWAYADVAVLAAGAVDVPIYTTLTPAQILYILNDAGVVAAVVSNAVQAAKISAIRAQAKTLSHVIVMDPEGTRDTLAFEDIRRRGREALSRTPDAVDTRAAEVRPQDLATIIYTSGTTGDPKGVMLTHDNLVQNTEACRDVVANMGGVDSCLSFLPLCHVFERLAGHYLMLEHGCTVAYAESIDHVAANLLEVRPSVLLAVPRFYEKVRGRVLEKVAAAPPVRRRLFHWAEGIGRASLEWRLCGRRPPGLLGLKLKLADALVFSKIRKGTGGRLRFIVSGGAALPPDVASFFAAAGMPIQEGYGLTETSPVIAANRPQKIRIGTVGTPLPGVEVKIADDGEILTRSRCVMKGYYGKPEATAEAIDDEGWFHTGDIGAVEADGYLRITDRKKDLIVTSGGKKIAPQPIENQIKTNPFVSEVVMVGNRRHFPAALIVPRFDTLEAWAREKGLAVTTRDDLLARPEVHAHYARLVDEMTPNLAQFEKIKKIALLPRELSAEAGELTPTLKVKRKVVEDRYRDVIDRLYEGVSAA